MRCSTGCLKRSGGARSAGLSTPPAPRPKVWRKRAVIKVQHCRSPIKRGCSATPGRAGDDMRISIKLRLAVAMTLLACLLSLAGTLGLIGMSDSNAANRETYSNKLPGATYIGDMEI